ncbi:FAD-dependent oxidoreductase [Aphanothece hegewaldii CCALA 016]|uniref:FAD-dependent oxidoreductase n=1 Tax=Aphanothece hegewaldii CCALA 016 TaxID=2107694 RepID=A0A2T1LVC0_9CHRO|nr:FAD-dependent oxidoreductase [Aphanothece hegewaldii]PSF35678.1 FAD-dependent oxidoreductase [Aphanothece hegewaldii CCALA 016]
MLIKTWFRFFASVPLSLTIFQVFSPLTLATPPRSPDQTVECDILVVGGGLSGSAATYEALLRGKTVCLTEITDWVGGQISSQGTSALDERQTQRDKLFYPQGYLEFRERIEKHYRKLNPGDCWVSESCFLPEDGHKLLFDQLKDAAKKGKGQLKWFPSTVVKDLSIETLPNRGTGQQITSVTAIQHQPVKGTPPLNTEPLSQIIEDAYRYENSPRFDKNIIRFVPKPSKEQKLADWYVIEATETGELIALADVPYRLGIDPRSYLEPSSSSTTGDPYCTQGFTYTFAMEATEDPQTHLVPSFYAQHEPYYSYELPRLANFNLVFTYRRIWSPKEGEKETFGGITYDKPVVKDISMQNWTWGNDYRPGTSQDNLIYTRGQLQATGQLDPGGWMGGLRTDTLRKGEEHAIGYFYWLVTGTTDSQLGYGVKKPEPNYRYLTGLDSPMGTVHGLSKYPYMREGRRIIGRPSFTYEDGFMISEIDISRQNYKDAFYQNNLSPDEYRRLMATLSGLEGFKVLEGTVSPEQVQKRKRSTIYPDSIGIGHYAIDFHPCMTLSPPEAPGNTERAGERQGAGNAYPFQIPLRAIIPQKIDNLLVAGKSIAVSHIASAAYRVHSFEWSAGAAAGITAVFAKKENILPYQLVYSEPIIKEKKLLELRRILDESGNPTAFPDTSIFNDNWDKWK